MWILTSYLEWRRTASQSVVVDWLRWFLASIEWQYVLRALWMKRRGRLSHIVFRDWWRHFHCDMWAIFHLIVAVVTHW
jgi:hypothetical protein